MFVRSWTWSAAFGLGSPPLSTGDKAELRRPKEVKLNRTPDRNKSATLLPDSPLWGIRQGRVRSGISLLLVGAIVLSVAVLAQGGGPVQAQAQEGIIAGLTLTSEEPGALTATWDAPTPIPNGYDVSWANQRAQSSTAYTTDASHTFTDLNEGEVHEVQVRARYEGRNGPWSDTERLRVAWQSADIPAVVTGWSPRIHKYEVARLGYTVNWLPADDNPETLDLTLRADIVNASGRDFDHCEQEGMGEGHNLYIIDEMAESFYMHYGSPEGDCFAGEYTIIATVRDGSGRILKRVFDDFRVMGGSVACVGCSLMSMPTISGNPIVGETLTADTSGISIPPRWRDVQVAYQWISHDGTEETEIPSATHETYSVAQSDLGKLIKVRVDVTYTDEEWDFNPGGQLINVGDATFSDHVKSLPTEVVVAAAVSAPPTANSPATSTPTITGTAQVGETLTAATTGIADADGLNEASFTYQWLANDTAISGATGSTYTLVATDAGRAIKVRVSFTDDRGNQETLTSAATTEVAARPNSAATGAPTISGTAQVGQKLSASTSGISDSDGLTNATFSYQWLSSRDTEIDGATSATYTLVDADEGKVIKVRVSFTDDRGNQETLTSAATGAVAAAPSPLTATIHNEPGSHDGQSVFTFELRFSEEVSVSYTTLRDRAFTVTGGTVVKARRLDPPGNIRWEISVRPDGNRDVTVLLPITADCATQGAICTADDRMLSMQVELTVSRPNNAATGAPTISGTAQVGQTLTASTSGISDSDGLTNATFSYQWLSSRDTEIGGATSATYTLVDADEGKAIKVKVSFTDDAGSEETLTSAATSEVAAAPSPLTVSLENNPASHNGTDVFTFQIRFSEQFALSFKTLQDHAFTVDGGTAKRAIRQVKGSNIGWTITVEPDSDAVVRIVLPATTDCDATGAICTEDGRKLSNSLDFTVSGPN